MIRAQCRIANGQSQMIGSRQDRHPNRKFSGPPLNRVCFTSNKPLARTVCFIQCGDNHSSGTCADKIACPPLTSLQQIEGEPHVGRPLRQGSVLNVGIEDQDIGGDRGGNNTTDPHHFLFRISGEPGRRHQNGIGSQLPQRNPNGKAPFPIERRIQNHPAQLFGVFVLNANGQMGQDRIGVVDHPLHFHKIFTHPSRRGVHTQKIAPLFTYNLLGDLRHQAGGSLTEKLREHKARPVMP